MPCVRSKKNFAHLPGLTGWAGVHNPICWILCLLCASCFVAPTRARAQTNHVLDDQAHAHFEAAQSHFDTGDYEAAIREFDQAYRLSDRAKLLYNLYLCYERLGSLAAAIDHLTRYLDADVDASNAAALKIRLENLRRRATALQAEPEPSTASRPALAPPDIQARDGLPTARTTKTPVIAALCVGGAGLVTFGAIAFMAAKEDSDLHSTCGSVCTDQQMNELRTYSLLADVSLGVGVTGLVIAGALWWRRRSASSSHALLVVPVVGRQSTGLDVERRF